jgi:hypothetical protein
MTSQRRFLPQSMMSAMVHSLVNAVEDYWPEQPLAQELQERGPDLWDLFLLVLSVCALCGKGGEHHGARPSAPLQRLRRVTL